MQPPPARSHTTHLCLDHAAFHDVHLSSDVVVVCFQGKHTAQVLVVPVDLPVRTDRRYMCSHAPHTHARSSRSHAAHALARLLDFALHFQQLRLVYPSFLDVVLGAALKVEDRIVGLG